MSTAATTATAPKATPTSEATTEPVNEVRVPTEKPPYHWVNERTRKIMDRGYLVGDTSPEERVRDIGERAEALLRKTGPGGEEVAEGFADRFERFAAKGFYSLASPVWSNFGMDRGLPISCFGSYIGDSVESILETHAEVGTMTKMGGGTAVYFGDVRPRGAPISNQGKTAGTHPFAQLFDKEIQVISQGNVRRGHCAGYVDIEHGDIEEWLRIQREGDEIQDMMWGVVVGDDWMEAMIRGDRKKREVWAAVLKNRMEIGVPYIIFRGNAQAGRPDCYKRGGYDIKGSNLCSEIMLPQGPKESFVCCLSSMNLAEWPRWKDTRAVETLTQLLDAVLTEFIEEAEGTKFMERPVRFAKRHRAIGIGALGWHSFLQSRRIPFDSWEANRLNAEIFRAIRERSYEESRRLGRLMGPAEVCSENGPEGRRHTTTMAVAPTKSSSVILGQVSPSVEPHKSNYYVRDAAKLKFSVKNPHLREVLSSRGRDTEETWDSIREADGSVQHLDFLSEREKEVFKTFAEIPQLAVVQQAAQRQKFIDQSQSLNLAINSGEADPKEINRLYIRAWKLGLKSLYYQKNVNAAQTAGRKMMTCQACEG